MMAVPSPPAPDGPDGQCLGIRFDQLNDYCLFELFEYLPFEQKIKYQRVNRKWGQVLERIWSKQRVLAFKGTGNNLFERFCRRKRHSFRDKEVISTRKASPEEEKAIWDRLTLRCDRLLALFWLTTDLPKERLSCLSNCTKLEHLRLDSNQIELLVPSVDYLTLDNLKCLELGVNEKSRVAAYSLVKKCQHLVCLSIEGSFEATNHKMFTSFMINTLITALPYLRQLRILKQQVSRRDPSILETIARLGKNIDTLAYRVCGTYSVSFPIGTEGDLMELLVKSMPNLKSLDFKGCSESIQRVLTTRRLEHLVWVINWGSFSSSLLLSDGKQHATGLKSLKLSNIKFAGIANENNEPVDEANWGEVLKIPEYFPNLEELQLHSIYAGYAATRPQLLFPKQYFSDLEHLNKVDLRGLDVKGANVQVMLENCPKIREARFISCRLMTAEVVTLFANYALLHIKRRIELKFSADFRRNVALEYKLPPNLKLTFNN